MTREKKKKNKKCFGIEKAAGIVWNFGIKDAQDSTAIIRVLLHFSKITRWNSVKIQNEIHSCCRCCCTFDARHGKNEHFLVQIKYLIFFLFHMHLFFFSHFQSSNHLMVNSKIDKELIIDPTQSSWQIHRVHSFPYTSNFAKWYWILCQVYSEFN